MRYLHKTNTNRKFVLLSEGSMKGGGAPLYKPYTPPGTGDGGGAYGVRRNSNSVPSGLSNEVKQSPLHGHSNSFATPPQSMPAYTESPYYDVKLNDEPNRGKMIIMIIVIKIIIGGRERGGGGKLCNFVVVIMKRMLIDGALAFLNFFLLKG